LLSDGILAYHNNIKNFREYNSLVYLIGHALEMAESDNILSDSDSKLISFGLSMFLIFVSSVQMLHSNPKAIHFTEVLKNEVNSIVNIAALSFIWRASVRELILHHFQEVVS
jgi:hypothetical protein